MKPAEFIVAGGQQVKYCGEIILQPSVNSVDVQAQIIGEG